MGHLPAIASLEILDDPQRWREAGFTVENDGGCQVATVRLELKPAEGPHAVGEHAVGEHGVRAGGVSAWTVCTDTFAPGEHRINGLPTTVIPPDSTPVASAPMHANGALSIDHLVVFCPSLDVTVAALGDLGLEPRRSRRHEAFGQPMRQVFFRMGEVILELVGPDLDGGEGDARFFGLTFTVGDLEATASHLGEHLGRIKSAVQPGRSIATLRSTAGLVTPVAFMTPEPPRPPT